MQSFFVIGNVIWKLSGGIVIDIALIDTMVCYICWFVSGFRCLHETGGVIERVQEFRFVTITTVSTYSRTAVAREIQ
jgi:hypothetical protein